MTTDRQPAPTIPRGIRLFQINESDLARLEHLLPEICERLYPHMDNRLRTQLRQVQSIMSDVRWNYGPPGEVAVFPVGPPST